ncbi:atherin-like [Panicum virgatum]|uniref:atherin-like n=1 Tax=Panicum virgatum TaxID=38727 RepID=UPI0019D65A9C|nr:atherin-like [Panicum virgatum]
MVGPNLYNTIRGSIPWPVAAPRHKKTNGRRIGDRTATGIPRLLPRAHLPSHPLLPHRAAPRLPSLPSAPRRASPNPNPSSSTAAAAASSSAASVPPALLLGSAALPVGSPCRAAPPSHWAPRAVVHNLRAGTPSRGTATAPVCGRLRATAPPPLLFVDPAPPLPSEGGKGRPGRCLRSRPWEGGADPARRRRSLLGVRASPQAGRRMRGGPPWMGQLASQPEGRFDRSGECRLDLSLQQRRTAMSWAAFFLLCSTYRRHSIVSSFGFRLSSPASILVHSPPLPWIQDLYIAQPKVNLLRMQVPFVFSYLLEKKVAAAGSECLVLEDSLRKMDSMPNKIPRIIRWELGSSWLQHLQKKDSPTFDNGKGDKIKADKEPAVKGLGKH